MPLIDEQIAALWDADGSPLRRPTVVSARPGTGKTTTVTEYCINVVENWRRQYAPWQGMAVLSYTNVAKRELEKKIRQLGTANALLSAPHFVGTLDAFLNRYVFLPFGAEQMSYASGRPRLVGEPHGQWWVSNDLSKGWPSDASSPTYFDCYSLNADDFPLIVDGNPRRINFKHSKPAAKPTANNARRIVRMKQYFWTRGLAIQSDANYFAYKALSASFALTKALAKRFPVVVIDEAQDMTAVQHAILDQLLVTGQEHIVLIGDEYQAIYEWNTAKPQLFVARRKDTAIWSPRTLTETFRCSPAICSMLSKMTNDSETIEVAAAGKNGGYAELVRVQGYSSTDDHTKVLSAISDMARLLSGKQAHDNPDGAKSVAVIARSGPQTTRLQTYFVGGQTTPKERPEWADRLTKDYLRVMHHVLKDEVHAAVRAYETLLFNSGEYETKQGMREALIRQWNADGTKPLVYRTTIFADLQKLRAHLPAQPDVDVSACAPLCDVALQAVPASVLSGIQRDCRAFGSSKKGQNQSLSALFTANDDQIFLSHPLFPDVRVTFSTVHGVKGETYDGVLFFTKRQTGSCGCVGCSSNRVATILRHSLVECEEKRIAYVALSRAAQVLFVLAPDDCVPAWETLL